MPIEFRFKCVDCGKETWTDYPVTPIRTCTTCGEPLCVDCGVLSEGRLYCSRHIGKR